MGRPNMYIAGDNLVSLSGVLRCCKTACWNVSTSRLLLGRGGGKVRFGQLQLAVGWGLVSETVLH